MLSSSSTGRTLRRPSGDFESVMIPCGRQPDRNWFRVHQSGRQPVFFSLNPNHRFSHPDCPYKMLYVGLDIQTCLFERFGDEVYDGKKSMPESLWKAHGVSLLRCPSLHVCDLTNPRTLTAMMVDYTALMNEKLEIPQEWGLAIQKHPANFQGIKYKSRFNGRTCLVIFDRDGISTQVRVGKAIGPLEHHDPAVEWIADHQVCLY